MIVQLLRPKDKKKNFKTEKIYIIRMISYFLSENNGVKQNRMTSLKCCQLSILYPVKISFNNEEE